MSLPFAYNALAFAKEGIAPALESTKEEIIKGYHAGSTAGLMALTGAIALTQAAKLQEGALYSFGAEPVVGEHKYGFVRSTNDEALRGVLSGPEGFYQRQSVAKGLDSLGFGDKNLLKEERSLNATTAGAGEMSQKVWNTILPAAFTLYFGADAYANDGMTGLGKYLTADFLGSYYGTQAATQLVEVSNEAKAAGFLKNPVNPVVKGEFLSRIAPIAASSFVGRALPMVGGILGATVGMEIGATIGSAATSLMDSGLPSDSSSRFLGGFLGAISMAKFGSYALSSIPRFLAVGAGVAAATSIVTTTMDAIGSGFDTKRGLNYAGDTAAYFTKNAVTMRQRAVQSMQKSNMNARSAFGQEASLMHMNRDMFSHYKRPLG